MTCLEPYVDIDSLTQYVDNIGNKQWSTNCKFPYIYENIECIPLIWHDPGGYRKYDENIEGLQPHLEQVVQQLSSVYSLQKPTVYKAILVRLPVGSSISTHTDVDCFSTRCHRVHLPIVTSENIVFHIGEKQNIKTRQMKRGYLYELDNTTRHEIINGNKLTNRVHLIIDIGEEGIRLLKFAHISKTGGLAIANIDRSLKWGLYDKSFPSRLGGFHTPPLNLKSYTSLLDSFTFFTVVRHPYDRIISEFYCKIQGDHTGRKSKDYFNTYIQNRLSCIDTKNKYVHFIPQSRYTHDTAGNQVIPHILRFSQLVNDVNQLLQSYGYKHRMSKKKVNQSPCYKTFTSDDFTVKTKSIIDTYYADDFRLLHLYF